MTAKRTDGNQAEIVAALRQMGAFVQDIHEVGRGCPDLLVYYRGKLMLVEVKSPQGKLTVAEAYWHSIYPGSVHIVRSVEQALDLLEELRDE